MESEVESLIQELDRLNAENWSRRTDRAEGPERPGSALLRVKEKLRSLGVDGQTIDSILERSSAKAMALEKIAVALFLQVIQDIVYPEHNIAQIKELRELQKTVRLEYNTHQLMNRHRAQVIELLKKINLQVSDLNGHGVVVKVDFGSPEPDASSCAERLL
jgi:hypothetical protein